MRKGNFFSKINFLDNISIGYLYFYIHFVTEVLCFNTLAKLSSNSMVLWIVPLIYDALAFVPQSIIGYMNDKYRKINFSLIGLILLLIGFISFHFSMFSVMMYVSIVFLCLGNACIHVRGAELTLLNSNGKLSHSAIFVSGGSLGVITGKLLPNNNYIFVLLILLGLSMIPFILLAEYYNDPKGNCLKFDYHNKKLNPELVIILTVFIVVVRGYIGYGIPSAWNKTVAQNILLFCMMGLGKAMGGILADFYGMKKVMIISMLLSIPFLIFGNHIMVISLIGVFFFSMTMSITLGILVSVLNKKPGLAFGLTTIGLFLGTFLIFFITIINPLVNSLLIIISTLICVFISTKIIRGETHG